MHSLKIDLYPDEVYTFTPKGDVFAFPRGAMPLDFAYRIHTDVGHHCVGARVNGKLVPLRTPLKNGDIVEILTAPNQTPSREWVNMVATSRARHKIRHWLNTEQKSRSTELGRKLAESSEVRACLATNLFRFTLGRTEAEGDKCFLAKVSKGYTADRPIARDEQDGAAPLAAQRRVDPRLADEPPVEAQVLPRLAGNRVREDAVRRSRHRVHADEERGVATLG